MRLINLKRVSDYRVTDWLEKKIPNLTDYQKERMRDDEIVRFAPFEFYERGKKVNNILLRFTIIFLLPTLIILILGLPVSFLITGNWGYNEEGLKWYSRWATACGF